MKIFLAVLMIIATDGFYSHAANKPHKPNSSVKPEEVRKQWQAELGGTVCDGISCVGPVEMLPQKWCLYGCLDKATLDLFSTECTYTKEGAKCNHVEPDKAAVPVEPIAWNVEPLNPFRTQTSQWANGAVVTATGTEIVALLPREEYEHLQSLRAAVVEEEKRLAEKYGADPGVEPCNPAQMCLSIPRRSADHYEFHGQFLLIDRGGK